MGKTEYKLDDLSNIYIAHQNSSALDEIQRMTVSYLNNYPIAVEGSPGTGKNHAIDIIANAFGKNIHRVRCTEEMVARDIIGGEKLVVQESGDNIATKTGYGKGKMALAMESDDMLVLDEFNQLLPTVQKGFNSALEDLRTIGSIEGTYEFTGKPGFGLFLTYNPDTGIAHEDLESAIKDRCKLIHFDVLPTNMQVYLAMMKTGSISTDGLLQTDAIEVRGVRINGDVSFVNNVDGQWKDAKGKDISDEGILPYIFYNGSRDLHIDIDDDELYTMTRAVVNVMNELTMLRMKGTVPFMDKFEDLSLNQINALNITPSSPRIVSKLVKDYRTMREMGVALKDISSDLALSVVDYAIQPSERDLMIGADLTLKGLVTHICAYNGLMTPYSAKEIRKGVMDAACYGAFQGFKSKGMSTSVAMKLVSDALNLRPSSLADIVRRSQMGPARQMEIFDVSDSGSPEAVMLPDDDDRPTRDDMDDDIPF